MRSGPTTRSRSRPPVIFLLLLGLATAHGSAQASGPPAVGDPAPELVLEGLDGTTYSLADPATGPRILIFFRGAW